MAQGAGLSAETLRSIVSRCEGVPLILEEVTRNALEPATRGQARGWRADPARCRGRRMVVESRSAPPPTQNDRADRRRARAGVFHRRAATYVSDQAANVGDTIAQPSEQGFFTPPGSSDRARFPHAMIRDAVYRTLLRDYRRSLHSIAADTLNAATWELEASPRRCCAASVRGHPFPRGNSAPPGSKRRTVARGAT